MFFISVKIPTNVLTHGYKRRGHQRQLAFRMVGGEFGVYIICETPNEYVNELKSALWQKMLDHIGDEVMIELLYNMSLFVKLDKNCYYQFAGKVVSSLDEKC